MSKMTLAMTIAFLSIILSGCQSAEMAKTAAIDGTRAIGAAGLEAGAGAADLGAGTLSVGARILDVVAIPLRLVGQGARAGASAVSPR